MVIDLKDFPASGEMRLNRVTNLALASPVEEGKVPKSKKGGHAVCIRVFRLFRY